MNSKQKRTLEAEITEMRVVWIEAEVTCGKEGPETDLADCLQEWIDETGKI